MAATNPSVLQEEEKKQKPIPLVLCGRTTAIARGVTDGLKPEFESMYGLFVYLSI